MDTFNKVILTSIVNKASTLTATSIRSILPPAVNRKVRYIKIHEEFNEEFNEELRESIRENLFTFGMHQAWLYQSGLNKIDIEDLYYFKGNNKISELLKKAYKSSSVHSLESKYKS